MGGLMTLVGGTLAANGDLTYSPALVGVGGLITSFAARQVNESSEAVGIKSPEVIISVTSPIVEILKAPMPAAYAQLDVEEPAVSRVITFRDE